MATPTPDDTSKNNFKKKPKRVHIKGFLIFNFCMFSIVAVLLWQASSKYSIVTLKPEKKMDHLFILAVDSSPITHFHLRDRISIFVSVDSLCKESAVQGFEELSNYFQSNSFYESKQKNDLPPWFMVIDDIGCVSASQLGDPWQIVTDPHSFLDDYKNKVFIIDDEQDVISSFQLEHLDIKQFELVLNSVFRRYQMYEFLSKVPMLRKHKSYSIN